MDQGLLQGLAEGLKTGLTTYRDEADRKYKREIEQKKLLKDQEEATERLGLLKDQRELEKIKLGLKRDDEGNWVPDPESLALKKEAREAESAKQEGLLKAAQIKKYEAEAKKIATEKPKMLEPELKAASDLRKEFQARPEIKRFSEVDTAFQKIQKAADNPSAAGDLSLIFGYMKMLDPGSTVREGEFANAQNAAGVPDKILNAYNRAKTGERLNPEQRKQFIDSAMQAYQAELESRQRVEQEFGDLSARYGVQPGLIYQPSKGLIKKEAPPEDPQIANYAKQYGLDYNKAKAIIDKRRGM